MLAQLDAFSESAMQPEEVASAVIHLAKKADSGSVWAILAKGQGLVCVPDVNIQENVIPLMKKEWKAKETEKEKIRLHIALWLNAYLRITQ